MLIFGLLIHKSCKKILKIKYSASFGLSLLWSWTDKNLGSSNEGKKWSVCVDSSGT